MMSYPMLYFDLTYVLILIGVVIPAATSARLSSTYQCYNAVGNMCVMTDAEAAERLPANQGIYDVTVYRVPGNLTDHYDPGSKIANLSDAVYNSISIVAIGVTAHKCGHAIQDANNYPPLGIRAALVPAVSLRSQLCWPPIIIGLLLGGNSVFLNLGILLFHLAVLFQLVTLSVEYDASHRAVNLLDSTGILVGQEVGWTRKVLNAAAFTYVAAAAVSILQFLRLLILFDNRRNDQGGNSCSDGP